MIASAPTSHRRSALPPNHRALVYLALASLAAVGLTQFIPVRTSSPGPVEEITAAATMERAITIIRNDHVSRGGRFDDALDPNHTGFIGEEYTGLTSTLGNLEAKRTTTNPQMAALLVRLLEEAGVKTGDTVAVGCSGSFPALAVATLSAAKAMGVHPIMIISIGASSFGANRPDRTILDIITIVKQGAELNFEPAAVSLGGADDVGSDFEPDVRDTLIGKIRSSGILFLHEPDLSKNLAQRLRIYFGPSSERRIAAFVNIGGSTADMGTSPLILHLEPGVVTQTKIPPDESTHGVVFAMAKRHIPVVHLLHIKGLVLKYNLPWDPIPLPSVVESRGVRSHTVASGSDWAISGAYFISVALILLYHRKAFFRKYS
jgi:poly-gamma-glutamate system protein